MAIKSLISVSYSMCIIAINHTKRAGRKRPDHSTYTWIRDTVRSPSGIRVAKISDTLSLRKPVHLFANMHGFSIGTYRETNIAITLN